MSTPVRSRQRFNPPNQHDHDPIDPDATTTTGAPLPSTGATDEFGAAPGESPSRTDTADTSSSEPGRRRRWRRGSMAPRRPATPSGLQDEITEGMTEAVVGLLAAGRLLAQLLLRGRGREPWPMTYEDQEAIAAPIGRIGARHLPVDLAPTVVLTIRDSAQCIGAVSRWIDSAAPRRRAAPAPQVEGTVQ